MSDFSSAAELAQALSEISSWGLRSESPYQVLPAQFCGPSESRAKVELLEDGESAVIGVSDKGWKIHLRTVVNFSRLPADSAAKDEQTFETLDHLLAYLSPAFERKRMEELSRKLGEVSVRRPWEDEDGDEEKSEDRTGSDV